MSIPLISVIMPVYNSEKYLRASIESILNQSNGDFEFIIVNDGSTDNSKNILDSFLDSRIKSISNPSNLGNYPSRNLGFLNAKGKYICVMDSDDISYPDRLEKQAIFLEENKEIGLIGSSIIQSNGIPLFRSSLPEVLKILFLQNNFLFHPSLMFRRELIIKHGLLYNESYRFASDYDFIVRAMRHFPVSIIKDILLMYRVHDSQITVRHRSDQKRYADRIRKSQLEWLGIRFSEQEFQQHLSLLESNRNSPFSINDYRKWLKKLLSRNESIGYYNNRLLSAFLNSKLDFIAS